jgi:C4-dicarboxylate transporter DctQ subunit
MPAVNTLRGLPARADQLLAWAEIAFIGAAKALCSILLFVKVVLRYVFLAPLSWTEELTIYLIVWVVFVGGSVAVRTHSHITVDLLPMVLSAVGRRYLRILVFFVASVFFVWFIYYSAAHTLRVRALGQVTPAMQAPMWLAYLAMPVGASLMLLRTVQMLVHSIRSRAGEDEPAISLQD